MELEVFMTGAEFNVGELGLSQSAWEDYASQIADILHCSVDEIVLLYNPDEEEPYDLDDVFGSGNYISSTVDIHCDGMELGDTVMVESGSKIYYAQQNASPWLIYGTAE